VRPPRLAPGITERERARADAALKPCRHADLDQLAEGSLRTRDQHALERIVVGKAGEQNTAQSCGIVLKARAEGSVLV
jgi:hypothetical protein